MRIVVADTGPLHYLVLIDAISVLPQLFESVMIPVTVRNEMLVPRTPEILRQWILHAPDWLDIVPDPAPEPDASLARLDEGERCAVQLALSVNASLVLMDDRAGVLAAERKGLLVTGCARSLGGTQATYRARTDPQMRGSNRPPRGCSRRLQW
jgi:predicted nucleic acid-binding protein